MSDIEIEIDGKKCQASPNAMVIQVADEAGIYIPRFCYHKHLTIAANCRMCLVEVEKSPKALPACATPVAAGMKVFTRSSKALAAQKAVMEFLLINHPLDCPICDQGGECELQDLSMGFGSGESHYQEGKRAVFDQDIGPLIETEMTRCIQCTRCVRFGAEIAGMRELGATGRGENMEIGTYIEHAMKSEVSGNVIDICPVGALTSKPFRFQARAWELEQRPTISPHDCVGSNLYAHMRRGKVMRMVPRENKRINETWISDRDRFSYEGLYHADRVTKPLIKVNDMWQEVDWQEALAFAASGIQKAIGQQGEQLGALVSPNATLEEFYLLQKVVRGLGSNNIDHRLRQMDFSDQDDMPAFPGVPFSLDDLEQCDTIFLIGSNIQKEQPSLGLRIRKAALNGAHIMALNSIDYPYTFDVNEKQIVAPHEMASTLMRMAEGLQQGKKVCLLLGHIAFNCAQAGLIRAACQVIAKRINGQCGFLTEGANAAGAWLGGAIPHRGVANGSLATSGLTARSMLQTPRKAYLLVNVEPDLDCANPTLALKALQQAEFVVSLSVFRSAALNQHANVILPIAPFTETSGTFVNMLGEWQQFTGVASSYEESRPAWKVLRVLGNLFHLEGFDYTSSEDVHQEIKLAFDKMPPVKVGINTKADTAEETAGLQRIGSIPLYAGDSLVRRAEALQKTQHILEGNVHCVRMHPDTAAELHVKEGTLVTVKQQQAHARLTVVLDTRLPLRCVQIAGGVPTTSGLGDLFGAVEITQ